MTDGYTGWHADRERWHRTPWYIFWRPKWRRWHGTKWRRWPGYIEEGWEFASDKTRARQVLEERCCPTRPNSGTAINAVFNATRMRR